MSTANFNQSIKAWSTGLNQIFSRPTDKLDWAKMLFSIWKQYFSRYGEDEGIEYLAEIVVKMIKKQDIIKSLYRGESSYGGYIYSVMIRMALHQIRDRSRRLIGDGKVELSEIFSLPDTTSSGAHFWDNPNAVTVFEFTHYLRKKYSDKSVMVEVVDWFLLGGRLASFARSKGQNHSWAYRIFNSLKEDFSEFSRERMVC